MTQLGQLARTGVDAPTGQFECIERIIGAVGNDRGFGDQQDRVEVIFKIRIEFEAGRILDHLVDDPSACPCYVLPTLILSCANL